MNKAKPVNQPKQQLMNEQELQRVLDEVMEGCRPKMKDKRAEIEMWARSLDSNMRRYFRKSRKEILVEREEDERARSYESIMVWNAYSLVKARMILEALNWDRIGIIEVENLYLSDPRKLENQLAKDELWEWVGQHQMLLD